MIICSNLWLFRTSNPDCSSDRNRPSLGWMWLLLLWVQTNPINAAVDRGSSDANPIVKEALPEADQMEFARSLEKSVAEHDLNSINDLIDWNAILDISTAGAKTAALEQGRKEFKKGFLKEVGAETNFSGQIARTVKNGGSFKFLRLDQVGEEPIALFRLKNPNQGGINYHQYFLKRSEDGRVRATDIFVFAIAERISDTLRRIWLPLTAETSKNLLQRFTQPMDPVLVALQSIPKMQKLVREGQGEQALEIYRGLPEKARQEKVFLLIRLSAAQTISEEEHAEAIEDFRKYHPNDAALDFLLIDGYVLKKDFEKALGCIDRSNKNVGGDSCLLSMRANVLARLGRIDEAETTMSEALKLEPELVDNYFGAIEIALLAKNYDRTVTYLTKLQTDFGMQFVDLTQIPVYAEFVKSPQYKKWIDAKN